MNHWRNGLLVALLTATTAAYAWMLAVAAPGLRASLALLAAAFILGFAGAMWHYREGMTPRFFTASLALGAVAHLGVAGLVVAGDRLGQLGVVPALAANGHHFALGVLGVAAAAFAWTRGRGTADPPAVATRADASRDRQAEALQRVSAALAAPGADADRVARAVEIVQQELLRLGTESAAEDALSEEGDVLSQAAALLEWGAQKLPELGELDVSDLLMAKAIADIQAQHTSVEHIFVDHRRLWAIHPIDRATADEKCNARAEAARAALPLLRAHGMRLSEELCAAHPELAAFKSVTGFQVVELGDGYVTFEGNGRREALKRAFGDELGVEVEVRLFTFDDAATLRTIQRRVERVREWKGVT